MKLFLHRFSWGKTLWRGPLLAGGLGLLLTVALAIFVAGNDHDRAETAFLQTSSSLVLAIQNRLAVYGEGLQRVQSQADNRAGFVDYLRLADLTASRPGALSVGLVRWVPQAERAAYQTWWAASPANPLLRMAGADDAWVIEVLEPGIFKAHVAGYDFSADTSIAPLLAAARKNGQPVLIRSVMMGAKHHADFFVFSPWYSARNTDKKSVQGFIYMPVNISRMMADIDNQFGQLIKYNIYSGKELNPENKIYDSRSVKDINSSIELVVADFSREVTVNYGGTALTITTESRPEFSAIYGRNTAFWILGSGMIFSLFIAVIYALYLVSRKAHYKNDLSARQESGWRAQYHQLMHMISDAVLITSCQGHILSMNQQAADLFNLNKDELTGRHVSDLFENLSPDETDKYLYRSIHQTDHGDDGRPVLVYCINHARAELSLQYLPHNQTVVVVLSTAAGLAWPEKQVMQERLQLAIDAAGMGIWEWSIADNQLRWDTVMYSLYGLDAITFKLDYARWSALILRDDLPEFDGAMHAMLLGGEPLYETVRIRRADGEIRYISMHGKLITDKYDQSEHIIGVNFDITPLKEAEISLRESEERFALAAQAAQEGIWDWNMQTGEVWFSPQWKANFGYLDHELANDFTTWDTLIDPEDRKRFLRLTQAYNQGVLTRFETTLRFKHKEGHWVSVRSRAVHLKNELGDVVRMVGSNEDITEILQHEAELNDSRKRMDLTIQCAGLGIWDWNLISNEVLFGGKWAEMLGYDDSDIAPNITSWVDLTHPDDLIAAEKILHSHFAGHVPVYSAEFRMRAKDGSWRWILGVGRVNAYTCEGKPMRILGVNIDIHTRKTNETALQQAILQAEAASRAKSEFLANMSHEIRTPLNAVLGFASLLEKSDLDIRQRDFVDSVKIAGNALLFLINDLLDFSKIEAGRLELNNADFNVRHLFEEALTIIAPAACDKHLEMACIVSPEVPEHAYGDSARIRQILLHLLNNAIKFTSAGHVVIRIACHFSDSPSVCLRVEITDTGVGIAASHRMKLFNAFTQADNSTTRRFGGTGMGLSVCKSLIDAMDGRIGTEEAEGGGSVFWIEIPLTVCAAPLPPLYAKTDKKILLLDAFAPRAQSLMILLERAGFKADYFADAIQGSAAADQADYLLLIADERAGAALLRRHPRIADLPCIILTDGSADLAGGAAYCLAKPVMERSLRRCLEEALALAVPAAQILQPFNHLSVLLAEDNLVNQRVAVLMLEHLGCRVDVAANGLEALNAVQKGNYDLVLMDCQMPEMDGYTSVSLIRALNGTQSDVPVVALTANAFKADEERCYAAGMNDFIAKPISNDQLMRVLARFFPTKSQAEPVQSGGIMNSFIDPESIDKEMSSIYQTFEDLKKMLGMDMTDELIQLFLPTLDECLSNLGPLIEAGEGEPVVVCAHKLKGAAAQMGALALADLCKKAEQAGRDNQLADAWPLHAEILALGGAVGQRLRGAASSGA